MRCAGLWVLGGVGGCLGWGWGLSWVVGFVGMGGGGFVGSGGVGVVGVGGVWGGGGGGVGGGCGGGGGGGGLSWEGGGCPATETVASNNNNRGNKLLGAKLG